MISEDLNAIGFDMPRWDDLMDAVFARRSAILGFENIVGYEFSGTYTDPSGARLVLLRKDGVLETSSGLVSSTNHRAKVFRFTDLLAHVDLVDDDNESITRFLAAVDDPFSYPRYDKQDVGEPRLVDELRLGALALEVRVHDSEEAWAQHEDGRSFAARHLVSPWLFAIYSGESEPTEANPAVKLSMVCDSVEKRVNDLTGKEWFYVVGESVVPITAAIPATVSPAPQPGSVVEGRFFMVASTGIWDREAR